MLTGITQPWEGHRFGLRYGNTYQGPQGAAASKRSHSEAAVNHQEIVTHASHVTLKTMAAAVLGHFQAKLTANPMLTSHVC